MRSLQLFRTFATKPKPLKFLIVDGYTKEAIKELNGGGASSAGDLYDIMLSKCAPVGCNNDIIYPAEDGFVMPDVTKYDGVAWTGCSLCIYADEPRVIRQIDLAKLCFSKLVPQFGSCWAAQISAVASGGRCAKNPNGREMGIARKIQLTPEGRAHPMYEGKPTVFEAFTSHEDEVTHVAEGTVVLSSNPWTRVQSLATTFNGAYFWGLQYHPEYDLHELARLTHVRIPKLTKMGFFRDAEAARSYVEDLETLHKDPSRKDLAWRYGVSGDVTNEDIRLVEVRNWISKLVLPLKQARH